MKNSVDHNFGLLSDNEGALQVHEVLSKKNVSNFTINDSASLGLAISQLVDQKLASALAVDEKGEISGIFTARDVLKVIDSYKSRGLQKALEVKVADFMTKKDKMVIIINHKVGLNKINLEMFSRYFAFQQTLLPIAERLCVH